MQKITVTVERIVYHNEEDGYLVARCSSDSCKGLITIVGNVIQPTPGLTLQVKGDWTIHPKYGRQFKLHSYTRVPPATSRGIEKYLGSGIIEKIGPGISARIVERFGEDTLRVIDKEPDRLEEVEGIGQKRKLNILAGWEKQKKARQVMLYLHSLRIGPSAAHKIYSKYGEDTLEKIQDNPYMLAEDIFGIGFKTADSIAQNMGIEKNSPLRIKAGINYVLLQSADQGHTFLPPENIKKEVSKLLGVESGLVNKAISTLQKEKEVIVEDNAVYHPSLYSYEVGVASKLGKIAGEGRESLPLGWKNMVDWVEKKQRIKLSSEQRKAITTALSEKVMVLTGGPGTGKTTTLKSIVLLFEEFGLRTVLAAPTGRAAKRLSQTTGRDASTIHRLLGFSPGQGFVKNQNNKLRADVVVVDEVSMIDLFLMNSLLKALPLSARLIMVGDADQLPAIGAGNVLRDIIRSGVISVVELKQIFRQARQSLIVVNAHRINSGDFPYLPRGGKKDFYFLQEKESSRVEAMIVNLCCSGISEKFNFDPFRHIQVISPFYKGPAGVERLNSILQKRLNPEGVSLSQGNMVFRTGDKVMQLKNNYEKEVFNGDIGIIAHMDSKKKTIQVTFSDRNVTYQEGDINQLTLAYAVSVHKSQGSEYPVVVMPVIISHYLMLQRNLLYTALTRAKKLAVFIGEKRALAIAVRNNKVARRYTKLAERLTARVRQH